MLGENRSICGAAKVRRKPAPDAMARLLPSKECHGAIGSSQRANSPVEPSHSVRVNLSVRARGHGDAVVGRKDNGSRCLRAGRYPQDTRLYTIARRVEADGSA